jgi:uncharacterized protein YcfJ
MIVSSCGSKKNADRLGSDASVSYPAASTVDSSSLLPLRPGTERVVVVETRSPNGSVTTTTTTEANKIKSVAPAVKKVATPTTVVSQPVATTVPTPVATEQKTGWSNRAKGAVIGGVGGAAAGAIISKKKVQGAVIGGAAGAAGGYIIGNEVDRTRSKQ